MNSLNESNCKIKANFVFIPVISPSAPAFVAPVSSVTITSTDDIESLPKFVMMMT